MENHGGTCTQNPHADRQEHTDAKHMDAKHTGARHTGARHTGGAHMGEAHMGGVHMGEGHTGGAHTGEAHTGGVHTGAGQSGAGHTGAGHAGEAHMSPGDFDASFTADMPRLRRRLIALTGNPHDADDLLQETYLRLSRRARDRSLTAQQYPYAYTCTVALNLLRDSWLHPSRRERTTDRLPEAGWDGGLGTYEASATALALLSVLSPKEAAAVILVDLEGLTHDTAGERLGAHRGTVQRNRMRALAKMRAALAG